MREDSKGAFNPELVDENFIDLQLVLETLWERKLWIFGFLLCFACISSLYALSLPDEYTSEALLAPKKSGGAGGLAKLARSVSPISGITGIGLGGLGETGDQTAVAKEIMKSRAFFREHLYDIALPDLFAAKSWVSESQKVVYDEKIYDSANELWLISDEVKPSPQQAYRVFKEHLTVEEDSSSGFIYVKATHLSPHVAMRWVSLVVAKINETMKNRDIREAQQAVLFLNEQRSKTSLVSLDVVFASLIEEQTKKMMLANASEQYVFEVVEPPVTPELRSAPNRSIIGLLGAILGAVTGIVVVMVRRFFLYKGAT